MPFIRISGVTGKIYVPDDSPARKKHKCPDCKECAMCSENRCKICRKRCKK